ncbi:phosphodiester glycosidase family protein [Thiotrichales bacterium 19S9-12]|nr:phosphodiester glycosidase family protein [Thiotrichales bacterium 19S9-11]MCF6811564.1 phosphodiester glycosidase family protein [Thiotrichales bacterium 19S9-12]
MIYRYRFRQLFYFIVINLAFINITYSWSLSVEQQRFLANDGGIYEHIVAHKLKEFPVVIDLIILDKSHYRADLFSQNWHDAQSLATFSYERGALAAINGGFYRENFLPNGLLVIDGKHYSKFVSNQLLSAVVMINQQGKLEILSKADFHVNLPLYSAFQAGPLLYYHNKAKEVSGTKLRKRSILVLFQNGDTGLVYFSPVTLSEVSELLKKVALMLNRKINAATNLDGGIASSFVVNFSWYPIIRSENLPVKMALLFFND